YAGCRSAAVHRNAARLPAALGRGVAIDVGLRRGTAAAAPSPGAALRAAHAGAAVRRDRTAAVPDQRGVATDRAQRRRGVPRSSGWPVSDLLRALRQHEAFGWTFGMVSVALGHRAGVGDGRRSLEGWDLEGATGLYGSRSRACWFGVFG